MSRVPLLILVVAACSSSAERARQADQHGQGRDSVMSAGVVKSLQPPAGVGRLIYERPADLSYDSLRVKRPELLSSRDRSGR